MRRNKISIWALSILLAISNVGWIYKVFDDGVTQTYMGETIGRQKKALKQIMSLFPLVINNGAQKSAIVKAAAISVDTADIFEKEGFTWVGEIGLQFDANGKLKSIKPAWE